MSLPLILDWDFVEIKKARNKNQVEGIDALAGMPGKFVYAIETPLGFDIRYQKGVSNICYIGRQQERTSGNRLAGHAKSWMARFLVLAQCVEPFTIHFCFPRRRNTLDAFKDVEAELLAQFQDTFGSYPIFNKRGERNSGGYPVENTNIAFLPRRGGKHVAIDARMPVDEDLAVED